MRRRYVSVKVDVFAPVGFAECPVCPDWKKQQVDEDGMCKLHANSWRPKYMPICEECSAKAKLTCEECKKIYPETDMRGNKCVHCSTMPFIPVNDGNRDRPCAKCKKKTVVNSSGLCYNCHIGKHSMPRCRSCKEEPVVREGDLCDLCASEPKCIKCHNHFPQQNKGDMFCLSCAPKCHGCKSTHQPKYRNQVYCTTCAGKIENYICLRCNNKCSPNGIDKVGLCYDFCSEGALPLCPTCNDGIEVTQSGKMCGNCRNAHTDCPECGTAMHVSQYVCGKCYKNYE